MTCKFIILRTLNRQAKTFLGICEINILSRKFFYVFILGLIRYKSLIFQFSAERPMNFHFKSYTEAQTETVKQSPFHNLIQR